MERVECPHCETSYTLKRAGLHSSEPVEIRALIACTVCKEQFSVAIEHEKKTQGFVARILRRPKPATKTITVTKA